VTKIERTLWSPDTCMCQIYEFWDSDLPVEEIKVWSKEVTPEEHGNGTVRCDAHKHHTDPHKHYLAVLEENQRKNAAHSKIGSDKEITWEFDSDRTLRVYHQGKKILEVAKP
jgi:hypothetical protein